MSTQRPADGSVRCHVCDGTGEIGGHWERVLASLEHVDGTVTLHREDVAFPTEIGERRAQQLMDEWAEKPGVELRAYEPPTAVNGYEGQRKALLVDLDRARRPQERDRHD